MGLVVFLLFFNLLVGNVDHPQESQGVVCHRSRWVTIGRAVFGWDSHRAIRRWDAQEVKLRSVSQGSVTEKILYARGAELKIERDGGATLIWDTGLEVVSGEVISSRARRDDGRKMKNLLYRGNFHGPRRNCELSGVSCQMAPSFRLLVVFWSLSVSVSVSNFKRQTALNWRQARKPEVQWETLPISVFILFLRLWMQHRFPDSRFPFLEIEAKSHKTK